MGSINGQRSGYQGGSEGALAWRHIRQLAGLRKSRPKTYGIPDIRDAAMRKEAHEVHAAIYAQGYTAALQDVEEAHAALVYEHREHQPRKVA